MTLSHNWGELQLTLEAFTLTIVVTQAGICQGKSYHRSYGVHIQRLLALSAGDGLVEAGEPRSDAGLCGHARQHHD